MFKSEQDQDKIKNYKVSIILYLQGKHIKEKNIITFLETFQVKENPNVKWEDFICLKKAKETLKETIIMHMKLPKLFQGKKTVEKYFFICYHTSKSFLAKAISTEIQGIFFSVSVANIFNKWMDESVKIIKRLFDLAKKKRPTIILLDKIDSIINVRNENQSDSNLRMKTEFFIQMQSLNDCEGILVISTSNCPWVLDAAQRKMFQKKYILVYQG